MEGIGSFISVVGLSSLFTGDIVIIFMAIILDIAKIVSVSFLYQFWPSINKAMKYYMTSAVLVLMIITSGGAFGYLSAAFQKAVQPNIEASMKVDAFSESQASLITEKRELTDLKLSINKQIAAIPTENEKARRQLIYSLKPELDQTNKRLVVVNSQLDDIRIKTLAAKNDNLVKDVHTGPIIYISKAFGISIEDASKYIILTIVAVFDPLAIMLVLAANFLIKRRKEELLVKPPEIEEPVVPEPVVPEPVVPEPVVPEPVVPEPVVEKQVEPIEPIPVVDVVAKPSYSGSEQNEFMHRSPTVSLSKNGMVL